MGKSGMTLQPLTPDLATQLGVAANTQGLVVTNVDPNGTAADAGLQQGDVILEVNRQPVKTSSDFAAAVDRSAQRPALILVNRRGATIYLTLQSR